MVGAAHHLSHLSRAGIGSALHSSETSRGHASVPNKGLRRQLSKYIPVIVSSEHLSSQRSACCHSKLDNCQQNRPGKKRVTSKLQCQSCKTLLSRGVSAACVILDIFEFQFQFQFQFQRQERTTDLPAFVKTPVVRSFLFSLNLGVITYHLWRGCSIQETSIRVQCIRAVYL
jgi:hypothetical protein